MQWPSECVESIGSILDVLGLKWTVAGALAALEYRATSRLTNDVDFLSEWDEQIIPALEKAGFEVRAISQQGEPPHMLYAERSGMRADILFPTVEYQESALKRSGKYLTVEDVIIHKLLAWRPRDRDDILSILDTDIELDTGYIEHWADEWDVRDRWEIARQSR